MRHDAQGRRVEAGKPRTLVEWVSVVACFSLVALAACSSSSSGQGGASSGDWTGTQSCNGWTVSTVPGAPGVASIPLDMLDVSATVSQDDGGITVSGLNIGPLSSWSCPGQTLVGSPDGPESSGVSYFTFATTPAACLAPTGDAGLSFDFTAIGDTYSSDGRNVLFLSVNLAPPPDAGAASNITAVGSCTIYLRQ
jgi:hypothetical protein